MFILISCNDSTNLEKKQRFIKSAHRSAYYQSKIDFYKSAARQRDPSNPDSYDPAARNDKR